MAQPLNPTRRRCAALMALSDVFEDEQIMRVMWALEEKAQLADRTTFIVFFASTVELFGISSGTLSNLYTQINSSLSLPEHKLPDDPMPQMLKFRNSEKASQQTKNPPNKINKLQEMTLFTQLISSIVADVNYPQTESYTLFSEVFKEEITNAGLDDHDRKQIITWFDRLNLNIFKKNIASQQLSTMVNCLYIALCEALGSVKADKILTTLPNLDPKQMREHFKHELQTNREIIQRVEKPYQFTFESSHILMENMATQDLKVLNQSVFKAHNIETDLVIDQTPEIPLEVPDPSVFKASKFETDKAITENLKISDSPDFKASAFKEDSGINNDTQAFYKSVELLNFKNLLSMGWSRVNKKLSSKNN